MERQGIRAPEAEIVVNVFPGRITRPSGLVDGQKRIGGSSGCNAFDDLYYLERACQTQVLAMSTGRPLKRISDNLAATAFAEWAGREGSYARAHFAALKRLLDREDA